MIPNSTRRGSAYLLSLIVSLMVVGMGAAGLSVSVTKLKASERSFKDTSALYIAEAGAAEASWIENTNTNNQGEVNQTLIDWYTGTGASSANQGYNQSGLGTWAEQGTSNSKWKIYAGSGGEFRVTRIKNSAGRIQLQVEGRLPAGASSAAGRSSHRVAVVMVRSPKSTTVTRVQQVYRHGLLTTRGSFVIGGGVQNDNSGWAGNYNQPLIAVNFDPANPTPLKNNKLLWEEGYADTGTNSDIGIWYAGSLYVDVATMNYDGVAGTENPLFGDLFAPGGMTGAIQEDNTPLNDLNVSRGSAAGNTVAVGVSIPGIVEYGEGVSETGRKLDGSAMTDFDGDGTTETYRLEVEGKFPDFNVLPVEDVIEGVTSGQYTGLYTESNPSDKSSTIEYELLKFIGETGDETRISVGAGTLTNDPVNVHQVLEDATGSNHNQMVLDWANPSTNGGVRDRRSNLYLSGGKLYIKMDGSTTQTELDLSMVNGGNPVTLLLDRMEIISTSAVAVKLPAGSTIITAYSATGAAGILIRNKNTLVFEETSQTENNANLVNRIYAMDNVRDKSARSIEISNGSDAPNPIVAGSYAWQDTNGTSAYYAKYASLYAYRDTQIVTNGIFMNGSGGATAGWIKIKDGKTAPINGGDFTLYTGVKDGGAHNIRVDGNFKWFSVNTDSKKYVDPTGTISDTGNNPDFHISGDGFIRSKKDIVIATMGNFRQMGGRIFAGGGGPSGNTADPLNEQHGGGIPTNMAAKTWIFAGYKGVPDQARFQEVTLQGGYLNPKLPPKNTHIVVTPNPNGQYGVIRFGANSMIMNGKIYAPEYFVHTTSVEHLYRGSLVVRGFPDDIENVLDNSGNEVNGAITQFNWAFDRSLESESPTVTIESADDGWGDWRPGGVMVLD